MNTPPLARPAAGGSGKLMNISRSGAGAQDAHPHHHHPENNNHDNNKPEDDTGSRWMSLRLLISLVLGTLIIAVAMLTFFLVFNVSLDSIRQLSQTHAQQVAVKTADRMQQHMVETLTALTAMQNMSTSGVTSNFTLVTDRPPGETREQWCLKYISLLEMLATTTKVSISLPFLRLTDWTIVQTSHRYFEDPPRMDAFCAFPQTNFAAYTATGNEDFSDIIARQRDLQTSRIHFPTEGDVLPSFPQPPPADPWRAPFGSNPFQYPRSDSGWKAMRPDSLSTPTAALFLAEKFGLGKAKRMTTAWPLFVYELEEYFLWPVVSSLTNFTGHRLGWWAVFFRLAFANGVLQTAKTTPNSQAFLIDSYYQVMGSTMTPWLVTSNMTAEEIVGTTQLATGCSREYLGKAIKGCIPNMRTTLNFAPVLNADEGLLLTATSEARVVHTDDGTYYVGSARVVLPDNIAYHSPLNAVVVIPEKDVAGDIFTQRDINLGIVFVCFVAASLLGFFLVQKLLEPLDDVALRMQQAAKLKQQDAIPHLSGIAEVALLQAAFVQMNKELLRIKGFVPQALLMAVDEDDADEQDMMDQEMMEQMAAEADEALTGSQGLSNEVPAGSTTPGAVDMMPHWTMALSSSGGVALHGADAALVSGDVRGSSGAKMPALTSSSLHHSGGNNNGNNVNNMNMNNKAAAVPMADAVSESRRSAHSDASTVVVGTRLAISATQLKTARVAVAVINLRHFNRVAASCTPELLVRLCDILASTAHECSNAARGVLDSFSGDHVVLTFNAARICPMAVQRAVSATMQMSKQLEADSLMRRIKDLFLRSGGAATAPQYDNALSLCAGVTSGMATVGNLGSNEIKRFSIIGEVFSRATELEAIGRMDKMQMRRGGVSACVSAGVSPQQRALQLHQQRTSSENLSAMTTVRSADGSNSNNSNAAGNAASTTTASSPGTAASSPMIVITSRDATDAEAGFHIEYVACMRLRHASAYITARNSNGDYVALARVAKAHVSEEELLDRQGAKPGVNGPSKQDAEWMYVQDAQKNVGQRATVAVRNKMFLALEQGHFERYRTLCDEHQNVPRDDLDTIMQDQMQ